MGAKQWGTWGGGQANFAGSGEESHPSPPLGETLMTVLDTGCGALELTLKILPSLVKRSCLHRSNLADSAFRLSSCVYLDRAQRRLP